MDEVIQLLESMVRMSIDTAPRRSIANIMNILIAICIEYNVLSQNAQNTIKTMAGEIEDLLPQKYKLEALKEENEKLKKDGLGLNKKNDHLENFNKHLIKFDRSDEQIDVLTEFRAV